MYCYSSFELGAFGSSYFLGYALCSIILLSLNKTGRRPLIIWGSFLPIPIIVLYMFVNNVYARYLSLFLLGITHFQYFASFMLLTELFPKWHILMVTTIKMAFEIMQDVVFPLIYFYYISKNWRYLHYAYGLIFTIPVPFLCFWLPESPHFLYERGRI